MTVITPRLFPVHQEQLTSDDYYTPRWVFDRMGLTFDLDVCAPPGGVEWIPATRYLTQADDGLASEWTGRVWMNPPFSGTAPWVDRFIEHRHGVCLVSHSRARWHSRLWATADALADPNDCGDSMFLFVKAGVTDNKLLHIFMPVFFAAFGDECVDAIARLGVVRTVR